MKKAKIIFLTGLILLGLTACAKVKEEASQILGGSSETAKIDSEELYEDLASIVSKPEYINDFHEDYWSLDVEFALYVFDAPEAYTFDDEESADINGHKFAPAVLARDVEAYFLLDVENITDIQVEAGKYYKVKASLEGTFYSTEGGERSDIAYFEVKDMEEYTPVSSEVSDTTFSVSNGDITIFDYEMVEDVFGEEIFVLYFEFENNTDKEQSPAIYEMVIDHAEMFLTNTDLYTDAELKHTDALASRGYGNDDTTPAGQSLSYYISYTLEDTSQPIYFELYDDEFNVVNSLEIYPLESPEGLAEAE
jgi:hypothetical protein